MNESGGITDGEARGLWRRIGDKVYLCGTLGSAYDARQRRAAAVSAAEAYRMQQEGLAEVERLMDRLEGEAVRSLTDGETLQRRRSPGYGELSLSLSREILDRLDATARIGVTLTDSLLLVPSKSVTAICGIARANSSQK